MPYRASCHAGNADAKGTKLNKHNQSDNPDYSVQFGRNYALAVIANEPPVVPARIVSKVAIYVPPQELVNAYLEEIAKGYGLAWKAPVSLNAESKETAEDDDENGSGGGVAVKVS